GQGGQGGDGQGGDGQGGDGQGGDGQGGDGQGGGGGAPSCDLEEIDVVDEGAFLTSDAGILLYNGSSTQAETILIVELWFQYGADEASHTFDFTGENYADCHTCVVLARDCMEGGDCGRRVLVQSGTLEVEEVDLEDGRFRGTLSDAVAVEVTFEGS